MSKNLSFRHVENVKNVEKKLISEAINNFSVCFLKALETSWRL